MPTETKPLLPSVDEAYGTIVDKVAGEVFFSKLAHAGIAPQSAEEAQGWLDLAAKLRMVEQEPAVKAAAVSWIEQLNQELDGQMAHLGLDTGVKQAAAQHEVQGIRQAARALAGRDDIYRSIIALKLAAEQEAAAAV